MKIVALGDGHHNNGSDSRTKERIFSSLPLPRSFRLCVLLHLSASFVDRSSQRGLFIASINILHHPHFSPS